MFKKALVALDLSPAAQPIIGCLPELKHWGVSHLVLTHVIEFGYAHGGALANQKEYEAWLEAFAEPLRATGLTVEVQIRASGVPADEVLQSAQEIKADLLVIGSRGQNLINQLFLGSVAREIVRRASLPVFLEWIEPTAEATKANCEAVCKETLRYILLATDFSEQAEAPERAAIELASRAQKVDCLFVESSDSELSSSNTTVDLKARMSTLVQSIEAAGGPAKKVFLEGDPASEIASYAQKNDVSLIIIGRHGRGWIKSAIIGSTAAKVCETSGRPVLLMP